MNIKNIILIVASFFLFQTSIAQNTFLNNQKRYSRVRTAISEKEALVKESLRKASIKINELQVIFVAYKEEGEFVLYAKNKTDKQYRIIKTFDICSKSGELGPKRKQGDYQVPEGFYHIDRFNPASNFYLSLGINYPNTSDRKLSPYSNLGGDIFIHGSCVTIGCLPMRDRYIKEIYLYAIHAKNNGQNKIPVYIFPFKMTDVNVAKYSKNYSENTPTLALWKNIAKGYNTFKKTKQKLNFSIDSKGEYVFRN